MSCKDVLHTPLPTRFEALKVTDHVFHLPLSTGQVRGSKVFVDMLKIKIPHFGAVKEGRMETAFVGGKDLTGKGTFWDNAKVLDLDLGVGHTGVYVCNYYVRFTVLFISIEKTHTYLFLQLHAMGCQWILPALPLD